MKVSAIVNCSQEGLLLRRSIDSVLRSVEASDLAEDCEVIVVADAANKTTLNILAGYRDSVSQIFETHFSDLGLARNSGVQVARGELVLFHDGDDLWSRNWVSAAWSEYLLSPPETILHPQYCIFFGARSELLVHPDWRDPYFDPRGIIARNHWISLCGARRDFLMEFPLPPLNVDLRFGFEDWSWYSDTIAKGHRHAVVPHTVHFIRLKADRSMQKAVSGFYRIPSLEFAEYLAADDPMRPYNL